MAATENVKLRVACCQFPVTADIKKNAQYIRKYMKRAKEKSAHLLHISEAALSGYAGSDFPSFEGFDWDLLRSETQRIMELSAQLSIWIVLGSGHFIDKKTKPTNCLYLINDSGKIVDRYDKRMCTGGDQKAYTAGEKFVTRTIRGVKIGLAICYDICFPQIYTAYRELGVQLMLHSFYNAGFDEETCLTELNIHQVPTRCADNRMWAVANNSALPHSQWGSFAARPDATIAKQLPINRAGMFIHDYPDGLSPRGWMHNDIPVKLSAGETLQLGKSSNHARQLDTQSEP